MAQSNTLILGKFVIGKQSVVGDPRRKWEDRVYTSFVEREIDDPLVVGIVADGVGSADFGARGAQLAVDTVVDNLHKSRGDDIPALLKSAMEAANSAVYMDNQANEGDGLSTLVVMVVYRGRCYVGNVGDSRAYWVRGEKKKILQLTRDHSYYNVYGGDPKAENANVVVNAIGHKPDVQVDFGFYLEPDITKEDAYRMGYAGVPLQPGDAIVLCSDGLIKEDEDGHPYARSEEIIEAVSSEYDADRAAIKMVSLAEGRRPGDNVSVVTLQYLTPQIIHEAKTKTQQAKNRQTLLRVGAGVVAFVAIVVIGVLGYQLSQKPTQVTVFQTLTPAPTMTATQPIDPGQARVDQVNGTDASVVTGQILEPGTQVTTGEGGVQVVVGAENGAGVIYLFGGSAIQLNFTEKLQPILQSGALYIQPARGMGEVHFAQWPMVKATVTGSRMIVQVQNGDVWVYCFEGECWLVVGEEARTIDLGSKRVYHVDVGVWGDAMIMEYEEKWDWNVKCNFCMFEIVPSPTPTSTPIPAQPTKKPKDSTYGAGFNWDDRFMMSEMQRGKIALQTNTISSVVFTFWLILLSAGQSFQIHKLAPYASLFLIIILAFLIH